MGIVFFYCAVNAIAEKRVRKKAVHLIFKTTQNLKSGISTTACTPYWIQVRNFLCIFSASRIHSRTFSVNENTFHWDAVKNEDTTNAAIYDNDHDGIDFQRFDILNQHGCFSMKWK